jgi:uncharacterized membrane protein YqjE
LGTGNLRRIEIPVVNIVATKDISNENTMNLGFLEQLCKLYPVANIIELMRVIVWMSPQTWRLVATTYQSV